MHELIIKLYLRELFRGNLNILNFPPLSSFFSLSSLISCPPSTSFFLLYRSHSLTLPHYSPSSFSIYLHPYILPPLSIPLSLIFPYICIPLPFLIALSISLKIPSLYPKIIIPISTVKA